MNVVLLVPVILSAILLGAHFWRADNLGLVALSLTAPSILLLRRKWVLFAAQGLLIIGAVVWIDTTLNLIQVRQIIGGSWVRLSVILSAVTLFTGASVLVFRSRRIRQRYSVAAQSAVPGTAAFFLTAFILAIIQLKVKLPLLLMERFLPGGGWIEILFLSVYAAWITEKMLDKTQSARWRRRIWAVFSIVFFAQLALGLAGLEKFLMTGKLHLPIPAMIIAGPLFRWDLSIMLFLFAGAILLVGPAWCSHLCYIGAWDDTAARMRRKPKKLPQWRRSPQVSILVLIIMTAVGLRLAGIPSLAATLLGLAFGLIGVGVMMIWSRKTGAMTHCISYCPIGVLATWLGKISPFRIRIDDSCHDCGICRLACRFDALNIPDIKRRKPNISCTLCGDCIGSCEDGFVEYRFLGMKAENARTLFIILAVSLHTVFLAVGRI